MQRKSQLALNLLALWLLVFAQGVHADNEWVPTGTTGTQGQSDYAQFFVHAPSIRKQGDYVYFWLFRAAASTYDVNGIGRAKSQKALEAVDCSRRIAGIHGIIYYDEYKNEISNQNYRPETVNYVAIKEGSVLESSARYACGRVAGSSSAKESSKEQLVDYATDAYGTYSYLPSVLTFIGSVFQVSVGVTLKKPEVDKETGQTIKNYLMTLHGDCANSTIAYDSVSAVVDAKGTLRNEKLSDAQKAVRQPSKDSSVYLTLQFVCGTKGYTVTAGPSKKDLDDAKKGGSSGTGFAITTTGLLLTNNHVIDECKSLTAFGADGNTVPAHVVTSDPRNDLALVKIDAGTTTPLPIRAQPIRSGDPIVALGFPYRGLLATEVNVSTGTVSAMAGMHNDTSKLQIQAPVQPGNSGGPLVDMTGAVVGVVVSKLDALYMIKSSGDLPQNVNFAVKGEIATLFLKSASAPIKFSAANAPRLDAAEVASRVKPSVYLLECKYE